MSTSHFLRFDWAMKRLLRHKSNFVVLKGFRSSLLGKKITLSRSILPLSIGLYSIRPVPSVLSFPGE